MTYPYDSSTVKSRPGLQPAETSDRKNVLTDGDAPDWDELEQDLLDVIRQIQLFGRDRYIGHLRLAHCLLAEYLETPIGTLWTQRQG